MSRPELLRRVSNALSGWHVYPIDLCLFFVGMCQELSSRLGAPVGSVDGVEHCLAVKGTRLPPVGFVSVPGVPHLANNDNGNSTHRRLWRCRLQAAL